jgi:hypothetical protein
VKIHARFEVFTGVKFQVKVFWVVTPCSILDNPAASILMETLVLYCNTMWHHNPEDLNLGQNSILTSTRSIFNEFQCRASSLGSGS